MFKDRTCCCIGPTFVPANAQMDLNMWMDITITKLYQNYHIRYFGIGRNAEELLRKVQAAQFVEAHGDQVCPAKWKPGEETLTPSLELVGLL